MSTQPTVIAIGGPPGAGKTTLAVHLSTVLGIPRLGSDTIGRIIKGSKGIESGTIDAFWVAYDVLFGLCDDFLRSGISTILDLNLGWAFQWEQLDQLRARHSSALLLPIVLRCPREVCLARIQERHDRAPTQSAPPARFTTDEEIVRVWDYLERLDRPDVYFADARRTPQVVYAELAAHLAKYLATPMPPAWRETGNTSIHHEEAR